MPTLKTGQPAPLFTLQTIEGEQISLSDVVKSGNQALLVFLRHLG
ncbi:MAG: redoxin domain-containing protein [Chloroflexi bacterium]|nr:redoxin domain-containing protein [Chloroflexota bacterium]MBI5828574.1 redoxin domain-containing protein [Chloroflexota bacterium]